jgi:DEAD/DEAH box helicase domain-containing protein
MTVPPWFPPQAAPDGATPAAPAAPQGSTAPAGRVLGTLLRDPRRARHVTHIEHVPPREGRRAPWPAWADPLLVARLQAAGVPEPWEHQVAAAELAWAGRHAVVATGTASGKSLAYLLPGLTTLLADDKARVLYLSPTKALAGDQLRSVRALNLMKVRAATYDGDTPPAERDWVRRYGTYVLTNPDMLHRGLLPQHVRWAPFLRGLRYVVVDECHGYRGVFGSHVAQVLRRLWRICQRYGASPTFVLASATVASPAVAASRLVGLPVEEVTTDASPRGSLSFALYEPPLLVPRAPAADPAAGDPAAADPGAGDPGAGEPVTGENGAPVRRSVTAETGDLLADFVASGVRTLAFVRSRRGAETVAANARRALADVPDDGGRLASRVSAYRAGYLPEERRALEADLQSGRLVGVAATNALELGLDVSGLDAVLLAGWPGTVASLWQQAGRAGRAGQDAAAVFVARDDPLDTYLVHHPEAVFGRPVEATVLDPDNPYVLGPHLECAAAELPLTELDLPLFGPTARALLADLVRRGRLRSRPTGWYWTQRERPDADLRGSGGEPVKVVEAATGRLLGTVDAGSAPAQVHTGAVYVHLGATFLVEELDLENGAALVTAADPPWFTSARDVTDIRIVETLRSIALDGVTLNFGTVQVTNQVTSFQRRRVGSGQILDTEPLDLPPQHLVTRAVWYTLSDALLEGAGLDELAVPGAAHAAEHAAIGLLPLFATCDRWDIGGVSTARHADTGVATVFVYDGHPGGAGFAEQGYVRAAAWLAATREAIIGCECATGCPSCVQSPKCGNGNEPLDKAGAVRLLDAVLAQVRLTMAAA